MDIEEKIIDHESRITKVEVCVTDLKSIISDMAKSQDTTLMLIKWVILPLIVVVGGLVGIKIVMPTV